MAKINRASNAQRLMEEMAPYFQKVREEYNAAIVEGVGRDDVVLKLADGLKALKRLEMHIWSVINAGKIEEHNLKKKTFMNRKGL